MQEGLSRYVKKVVYVCFCVCTCTFVYSQLSGQHACAAVVRVSGTMSIVMDEVGLEVPSENLMVYKISLLLDTSSHFQCLDAFTTASGCEEDFSLVLCCKAKL